MLFLHDGDETEFAAEQAEAPAERATTDAAQGAMVKPQTTLHSMSATLLAFAKPFLAQVEYPPTAMTLRGILSIAMVVWNLPLHERAKHANAAMLRVGTRSALGTMPREGRRPSQP